MIHAVAICQDGTVYTLPRPARHHDVIFYMAKMGLPTPIVGEQGFLDSDQGFVDRKQAVVIAQDCGQIERPKFQPNALFSEDLW